MLWRAMLRGTATGLLARAATSVGANVQSSKDTPVQAGTMPWFVVYADASKTGESPVQYKTHGVVTIEIRAEADAPDDDDPDQVLADGNAAAEQLFDDLCELVETTLLGGQGFDVSIACVNGSDIATPDDVAGISQGMIIRGPGAGPECEFLAIKSVNADETVTLARPYGGATGSYLFNVGTFIGLFDSVLDVKSYYDSPSNDGAKHVFSGTIEIKGSCHEIYEPALGPSLTGLNIYIDSQNIFDPNGDYSGQTPFSVAAPAPRTTGPDGRAEGGAEINIDS